MATGWEIASSIGTCIGGLGALGGALAAWRAAQASAIAAAASTSAARDARMALALQDRPWPHVNLWRADGIEGRPWRWYVTLGAGHSAVELHMHWTIDGQGREAALPRLDFGGIWEHPALIDAAVDAGGLVDRIGTITIEWQDAQGLMRWKSSVRLTEGVTEATPAPYGNPLSDAPSRLPFVDNDEPIPVW